VGAEEGGVGNSVANTENKHKTATGNNVKQQ